MLALTLALAATAGCGKKSGATNDAGATPSAKPSAARLPSTASAAPPKAPSGCRALTASGSIRRLDGSVVLPGAVLEGKDWLELEKGASLTLRHSGSAREFTLTGPARARPCRDGEEQIALARGGVKTSAGAGARPGAEVLVFTPFGTVRYGDASLTVNTASERLTVELEAGEAWLAPAEKEGEPVALRRAKPEVIRKKPNRALLEQRCETLAQSAAELGKSLVDPGSARSELAKKAVLHVKARRAARLACGEGEAYAGSLEGEERGRLLDRFKNLDGLWRAIRPHPSADNP